MRLAFFSSVFSTRSKRCLRRSGTLPPPRSAQVGIAARRIERNQARQPVEGLGIGIARKLREGSLKGRFSWRRMRLQRNSAALHTYTPFRSGAAHLSGAMRWIAGAARLPCRRRLSASRRCHKSRSRAGAGERHGEDHPGSGRRPFGQEPPCRGLVEALPAPWAYMATAQAFDAEMEARIALHRDRRGAGWQTFDTPLDLAEALDGCPHRCPPSWTASPSGSPTICWPSTM